jgi:uncharacterized protein YciI
MSQHFALRLVPPRATFPFDMDEREAALMAEHAAYLRGHFEAGAVLLYGPVLDADMPYGLAVLEVADEAAARAFADNDPTVLAGVNSYQLTPMVVGGAQGSRAEPSEG